MSFLFNKIEKKLPPLKIDYQSLVHVFNLIESELIHLDTPFSIEMSITLDGKNGEILFFSNLKELSEFLVRFPEWHKPQGLFLTGICTKQNYGVSLSIARFSNNLTVKGSDTFNVYYVRDKIEKLLKTYPDKNYKKRAFIKFGSLILIPINLALFFFYPPLIIGLFPVSILCGYLIFNNEYLSNRNTINLYIDKFDPSNKENIIYLRSV